MTEPIRLSKSRYCKGLQCPKMLWMDKNMPEKADETQNDAVFENGTKVGGLARSYFGAYELVPEIEDKAAMITQTAALLESGADNICEASFSVNSLYCAVDILHKDDNGWDIVEVKSSTHVSDIYKEDMAFQYYVLSSCGINVKKVFILYVNNAYVRHGELDLQQLFKLEDYTAFCLERAPQVRTNIDAIRAFCQSENEPEKGIGSHCSSPYSCLYRGYCFRTVPVPSVLDIAGLAEKKKFELLNKGIITYEDVLREKPKLSEKQLRQVQSTVNSSTHVDKAALREFLGTIEYPVYHLDFETFQQGVPEYDGCRPYCQIPFQYSLHIEQDNGEIVHREFLAKEGEDPRRAVAESLCTDIPREAFCLAYNMSFEKQRLKELAEAFPDLSEHLLAIHDNMHDLILPFRSQSLYSYAMEGSSSIKNVLPALFPDDRELDYHSLEGIHKGDEASNAFATLSTHTPEEVQLIRVQLLKYCNLDTYAMVKLLSKIRELAAD